LQRLLYVISLGSGALNSFIPGHALMRQLRLQITDCCLCLGQLTLCLFTGSSQRAYALPCRLELVSTGTFMMHDLDRHFALANKATMRPMRRDWVVWGRPRDSGRRCYWRRISQTKRAAHLFLRGAEARIVV
jgi:hypothetical protein